jgi:pSer/pThr/pTyr-binding forkhead associated (FHA) protein
MADFPELLCTEGPLKGQVFPIADTGLDIGRAEENHVVLLGDPAVSRFHARLLYDNGSLWLRDAGSRNGVFVNNDRLSDHKDLRVGDVVRIGGSAFVLRWHEAAAVEEPAEEKPPALKRRFWPFG